MEAARAATILRFAAGEAWRPIGEVYAASVPLQRLYTVRRPVGVVGLITPWNFPIAIPVWKLAPALIYGNTVVLKLGYEAPRTGLHVAECFAEAGLPPGVLNVLTGSGSTVGAELVSNEDVRAISFTGSVAVGHSVRERGDRARLPGAARARRSQPARRDGRRRARPGGRGRRTPAPSGRRARSAPRRAASTSRRRSTTRSARSSSPGSPPAASATRPTPRPRSARSSTKARWRTSSPRSSAAAGRAAP